MATIYQGDTHTVSCTVTDGGVATSANQSTEIGHLATLAGALPLTDTQLRQIPVPVSGTVTASGPLTDTQLRQTAVPVADGGGSLTVDGGE